MARLSHSQRVPARGKANVRRRGVGFAPVPEREQSQDSTSAPKLSNLELAVYALFLAGGISRRVHTEDVALRCFQLAPDAFSWIRHPELPDKEVARFALTDARKSKNGALVTGRAGRGMPRGSQTPKRPAADGWMLTDAGTAWVMKNERRLLHLVAKREPRHDRQDLLQKLSRVRAHSLFRDFVESPRAFSPSLGEMADLFRCRPDAPLGVWQKRIQTLRNQARVADQTDTLNFLDRCLRAIDSTAPDKSTS